MRPDPAAPARGRTRGGALAGAGLGAALGAAVFLLAAFVYDRLLLDRRPPEPTKLFTRGGEARGPVRVLSTNGFADVVGAVLLPLREDGADTGPDEAILDAALFPQGPPHRWARLLVANPPGAKPLALSLAPGSVSLTLEGVPRPAGNVDLAAAVEARAATLSPHRLLDLRIAHAADRSVEAPPGGLVRVLVAFPREADPRNARTADLACGLRLIRREVSTDSLRSALFDGRIDRFADADRAEARAPEERRR